MLAPLELGLEDRTMSKIDELRHGAPGETAVHLCVDMQRMFAEATEWQMPWLERVLSNIVSITSAHPERTIFTQFVPARKPGLGAGMWRHYYERWRSMTIVRGRSNPGQYAPRGWSAPLGPDRLRLVI